MIMPPAEYDHPYKGKLLRYTAEDQAEIRSRCPRGSFHLIGVALACTYVWPGFCIVAMVPDDRIRKAGFTPEIVLRHEIAHCNGWPGDHRGARAWQNDWAEAPVVETEPVAPNTWLADPRISGKRWAPRG
jgi:hypothetical protein